MDTHALALKTYEDLQKRKKQKELKKKIDLSNVGYNGVTKAIINRQKRYYDNRHTIF
jgi:hypothetical protein